MLPLFGFWLIPFVVGLVHEKDDDVITGFEVAVKLALIPLHRCVIVLLVRTGAVAADGLMVTLKLKVGLLQPPTIGVTV